ncbi:MAG: PorP/SprF family type IX secretion system membrane protein [Lewinellaceae bacterium]|nr:PorP/SprF family type IX secretion system membrane protein [Lewinellaceae bacterium]
MSGVRFLVLFLLFSTTMVKAQQLSLFTQYRENMSVINPAAIDPDYFAFNNNISFGASYRTQWTGLTGGPRTLTLRGNYFADQMSGVALMGGGHLISDQTGPTGFTGAYGRLAGVITSDPEYGGVAIGISAGFVQYRVKASEIVLRDPSDVLGTVDQSQMFPDVGVGVFFYKSVGRGYYGGDYVYGGVSIPQVIGLDLTFQNDNGEFFTKRVQHFYGLLGYYKFFDNDSFLEPSLWVKYAPNAPANVDFNLRYQMPASLWIGTGASSAGTMHLEAGFVLGENVGMTNTLKIGYGYDYSFSTFGPTVGSTHEINLSMSIRN